MTMTLAEISLELLLDGLRRCAAFVLLLGTFVHICQWLVGRKVVRPRLYFKPSSLSRHLQRHMSALERPFTVPRLLTPRHLQTLLGPLVAAAGATAPPLLYRRQYLQLRDRCSVPLDWAEPLGGGTADPGARLLLVLPDLLLDDSRLYAPVCRRALAAGCLPVVVNFRQLVRNNLPATRVAALYDVTDLRWVVRFLRAVCPGRRLTAIGFGNGGSLLLAYLGEHGISCQLAAAAVVSPAWGCDAHLLGDACAPYAAAIALREKYRLYRRATDASAAAAVGGGGTAVNTSFADFHHRVHGEDEERHNPVIDIDEVSVPLLAVHADDDPLYGAAGLPLQLFTAFPHLFLLRAPLGGHCGFYTTGSGLGGGGGGGSKGDGAVERSGVSWAADTAVQFIDCVCGFLDAEDAGGAGGMARAAKRVAARVARRSAALRVKNSGRTHCSGGPTLENTGHTPEDSRHTPGSSAGTTDGAKCAADSAKGMSQVSVGSPVKSETPTERSNLVKLSAQIEQNETKKTCESGEICIIIESTSKGDENRIAESSDSLLEDSQGLTISGAQRCTACGAEMCAISKGADVDDNDAPLVADNTHNVSDTGAEGTACGTSSETRDGDGASDTNGERKATGEENYSDGSTVTEGLSRAEGTSYAGGCDDLKNSQSDASLSQTTVTLSQLPEHAVSVDGNSVGHLSCTEMLDQQLKHGMS